MKVRLIIAALAAVVALVGCDYRPVEACNKRGVDPGCRTIWVQTQHHLR